MYAAPTPTLAMSSDRLCASGSSSVILNERHLTDSIKEAPPESPPTTVLHSAAKTTSPLIPRASGLPGSRASGSTTTASSSSGGTLFDMQRQNIRALSLIVCTFTYLMVGAAIFDALESEQDKTTRELVEMLQKRMQDKYNFSNRDYEVIEDIVMKSIPQKAGWQWRFAGAFYFATVVITTVGYGHSTPSTFQGKAFCIFYALAGIPLNLVMFQSIGERLNALICCCLRKVRRWLRCRHSEEVSMTHQIFVSSTLGFAVVFIGTYLFNKYERWGYFDSFYYCFITLTTIGFGDYVAMQKENALQEKTEYVVFSLLFILFGMALFAAAVNLFVLRFMATTSDAESLEKPRMKTVVLQGFSQDQLNVVNQGPRSGSILVGETGRFRNFSSGSCQHSARSGASNVTKRLRSQERALLHRYLRGEPDAKPFRRCWSCCTTILRQLGFGSKPRYTVRRAPTRISHLLHSNSVVPDIQIMSPTTEILDTPQTEVNSIPLQEIKRPSAVRPVTRRPSI